MANPRKRTLSKNLSQMKFMKRQSLTGPEEEADSGSVLTEKWVVPDVPLPTETEPEDTLRVDSFLECEELDRLGRFSFNGYNKEIERLMRVTVRRSPAMVDAEEDADIPAEEVAKRYEMITSKKLLGKRKREGTHNVPKKLDRNSSSPGRSQTRQPQR